MLLPARHLVIVDGDMPGLLACAAAAQAAQPAGEGEPGSLAWMPALGREDQPARVAAARRMAEYYGLEFALGSAGPSEVSEHERTTVMLVEAAFEAARHGASAAVWPVCCQQGPSGEIDLARLGLVADRALLVQRLVSLGHRPVQVLTPYLDFSEREVADLTLDLNLPVPLCWWWGASGATQAAAERGRWTGALATVGWSAPEAEPPDASAGITRGSGRQPVNEEVRRA